MGWHHSENVAEMRAAASLWVLESEAEWDLCTVNRQEAAVCACVYRWSGPISAACQAASRGWAVNRNPVTLLRPADTWSDDLLSLIMSTAPLQESWFLWWVPLCSAARVHDGILPPAQATVHELSSAVGPCQIPRQLSCCADLQHQRVEQVKKDERKCSVYERWSKAEILSSCLGHKSRSMCLYWCCYGSKHQDKNWGRNASSCFPDWRTWSCTVLGPWR